MSETLLNVRKTNMKIHGSYPKGLYSILERQTSKQLEYNCQNENPYKLQCAVQGTHKSTAIWGRRRQEVGRGPEKASQRR